MAARYEQEEKVEKECENCGEKGKLYRCSRCRSVYFCSLPCHKAYWPFHVDACKKNEFADAIEGQDPKFSRWMRRHARMAVVKDDEVDRLERASRAVTGTSRQEVMDSMYGRLDPKPRGPTYTLDELRAMERAQQQQQQRQQQQAAICQAPSTKAWGQVEVAGGLGLDCGHFKWRQDQSRVEAFFLLPALAASSQVRVELGVRKLVVEAAGQLLLGGELLHSIQMDGSTWSISEGVLEVSLLKSNRRDHYEDGKTNADTFWRSVLRGAPPQHTLHLTHAPTAYYWTAYERADGGEVPAGRLLGAAGTTGITGIGGTSPAGTTDGSNDAGSFGVAC